MLYYGDRGVRVAPAAALGELAARWSQTSRAGRTAAALGALLVDAGMLAQGLADEAFAAAGEDAPAPSPDAAMALCLELGRELVEALDAGARRRDDGGADRVLRAVRVLGALPLPAEIELRVPEGYAHYAVYPEAYVAAARRLPRGAWVVVGIRSIGTSLAAAVAAALGARHVETVRPRGHPHHRHLAVSSSLRARLLGTAGASFAVVDEGPGMSGSSFASVSDELERAGVSPSRIHLFPSHAGEPGSASNEETRKRWRAAPKHVVTLDDLVLGPDRRLCTWLEEVVPGISDARVEDLSAGGWRRRTYAGESGWPAVFAQQERRKLLLEAGADAWLVEFVGLGSIGERRLARARSLADAGFAPRVEASCRGFLVRRWVHGEPLDRDSVARREHGATVLDTVARYLAFRARSLPADGDAGAPLQTLAEMLDVNAVEAFGEPARDPARKLATAAAAASAATRIQVDGKLEPWEWLRAADGALLKTDGFQHADAHDLVGAQPASWDVAGAVSELDLSPAEAGDLLERVQGAIGASIAPEVLAFHLAAYAAFRLARWTYALEREADPAERARIEGERARHRAALARALSADRRG